MLSISGRSSLSTLTAIKYFNNCIVLVTALPDDITSELIFDLYRLRWQVELYFKRLKSIMNYGELLKRRSESVFVVERENYDCFTYRKNFG